MSALTCQHPLVHCAPDHPGWVCIGCGTDIPSEDATRRLPLYATAGATHAAMRACLLGAESPALDAMLDMAQSEVIRLALSACISWVIYDATRADAGRLADMRHAMNVLMSAIEHYDAVRINIPS